MGRNSYNSYNNRNRRRRDPYRTDSGRKRGGWNKTRIFAALACFVAAIALIVVIISIFPSANETPDNTATRLAEQVTPPPAASGDSVIPKDVATPEPTPKHRKKAVALTFDDGPKSEEKDKGIKGTNALLDTLKEYDAHATFFVVGNRCEVDKDILKREIDEGHEIGNHSWDHPQLGKLPMSKVNKQLGDTARTVKKLTGYKIRVVRPPYGSVSDTMRKELKYPMIIWDVDSLDWKVNTEDISQEQKTKKIMKNIKSAVKDGSIILMHDIHESSCEAVKTILPWLIEHDYDVLTVSELMERNGISMKNGRVYASASLD